MGWRFDTDTGYMVNIETSHFRHMLDDHEANLRKLKPVLAKIFSSEDIAKLERMTGYREVFVSAARNMPRTFCHGDFRAQNILWNSESISPRGRGTYAGSRLADGHRRPWNARPGNIPSDRRSEAS